MAARGLGLFSLYIYIENFKNLLVRNHWTNFNIILQKCSFGDPLPRLFKPFGFVKKHSRQGAGLIFPIYLYRSSKQDEKVACSVISPNFTDSTRLPDNSSIFTAEAKAIDIALYHIRDSLKNSSSFIQIRFLY